MRAWSEILRSLAGPSKEAALPNAGRVEMLSGELPCRRPFSRRRAGWHLASYASFDETSCSAGGPGRRSAPTRITARAARCRPMMRTT